MAAKLYVGGLAYSTTDDSLQELFKQYGTVVSARVIKDRESGQSKGFGFVEFEEDKAAQEAINALDGREFEGRNLMVNVARPQEERPRGGGGGGGGNNFRGGFQRR